MRRGIVWLLVPVAVALVGCSASTGSGTAGSSSPAISGPPPGASSTASPTTTPTSMPSEHPGSPPPPASGVLVEYTRRGGFTGLSDHLVVRQDGGFTVTRLRPAVTRSGQLTTVELADLRRVLAQSGFAQLPKAQTAQGNDLYAYQVGYQGTQIVATDGAIVAPLQPVLAALSGIVARYGS